MKSIRFGKKTLIIKSLTLLLLTFFITSCVGTIKDANSLSTKSKTSSVLNLKSYPGVESVTAVADSKVEVFFPALNGDAEKTAYVIRYSGQQVPIYIQGDVLKPVVHLNANQERVTSLKATISDLRSDTDYEFSVEVRDITTGSESSNNVYKPVKTFPNLTAHFMGVGEVKNLAGVNGLNGIEVFWTEAEIRGTTISKNDIDPTSYEITIINGSTPGLAKYPSDMNDKTLAASIRSVYTVAAGNRSFVINGLRSFTKYYVQVRAIHYGKSLNAGLASYKVEENTNYQEVITYDPSRATTIENPASFSSSYPPGAQGLTSINLAWQRATGVFDHYRAYYSLSNTALSVTASCSVDCDIISSSSNLHQIVGVNARQLYYLTLIACRDVSCSTYVTYNRISHLTTPPVITSYAGIFSIDTAKNLSTLDKLFLNVAVPDFNLGYIVGIDFYGCHSSTTANCNPNIPANLLSTVTNLAVDPSFDYTVDSTIPISGIDPASTFPYCFYARPFIFNNLNAKAYVDAPLSTVKCRVPEIKAAAFSGFDTDSTCDLLKWQIPTTGVFDGYEIYYRLKSSVFETSVPLTEVGNTYTRVIVNPDINEYSTLQLPLVTGGAYDFGIRTIYRSAVSESTWLRSSNVSIDKLIKCPKTN
jgi:hypothetical protein